MMDLIKNEILRMEHILCDSPNGSHLNYLSMQVFEGEIFGILTLEQPGIDLLVSLISRNISILQGRVYYQEKLVNQAGKSDGSANPVAVIGRVRKLFPELSVADNLFTAQGFFRKYIIPEKMIRSETKRYLKEAGLHLTGDVLALELSEYESIVIEILSAIISGNRLIVLWDALQRLSVDEQERLTQLMRRWTKEGSTFLLIYGHHETLRTICDRIAVFKGETIQKIVQEHETLSQLATTIFAQSAYDRLQYLSTQKESRNEEEISWEPERIFRDRDSQEEPILSVRSLQGHLIRSMNFDIFPAENVLFYGSNTDVLDELGAMLAGQKPAGSGLVTPEVTMQGRLKDKDSPRMMQRVLIPRDPTHTLLFPEMSALENFCLPFADRIPDFWMKKTLQRSVMNEYNEMLGGTLEAPDLYRLSARQRYDILYLRYLLARPRLLICVQPLMESDMNLRMHLLSLMLRLQENGIAILVLNTELYDTIYIADRLLVQQPDGGVRMYSRQQFASLREQQGTYFPD